MNLDLLADILTNARWYFVAAGFAVILYSLRDGVNWKTMAREVVVVLTAYVTYFAVRGLIEGDEAEAIANAGRVIDLERSLGIFREEGLQDALVTGDAIARALNFVYIWGHWPLLALAATWLMIVRFETYRLYRNAMIISGIIGVVVIAMFPVAPPRLTPDVDIVDTVRAHSDSYRSMQPGIFTNRYAAVPSLHFGWNLLVGIAILRSTDRRWAQAVGIGSAAAMGFAIVLTGNHYLIDAAIGAAIALLGLLLAVQLRQLSEKRRVMRERTEGLGSA